MKHALDPEILGAIEKIKLKKIIVEGKKDRAALERFGCTNILTLEDKALFEVVEAVNEKEVVVLTDLDGEGRKLYARLQRAFAKRGVHIDNALRILLFKHSIGHIEGLH